MISITRWFVLSSVSIMIFGLNAASLLFIGQNLYLAHVWVPFWTIAFSSRIMISFTQVMLGAPEGMRSFRKGVVSGVYARDDKQESSVGTTTSGTVCLSETAETELT